MKRVFGAGVLAASLVPCAGLLFLLAATARAQTTASLTVRVSAGNSGLPSARVTLLNPVIGFHRELTGNAEGEFRISQVPAQGYQLLVQAEGFEPETREVSLRTNVPVLVEVRLKLPTAQRTVDVSAAGDSALLDTQATGSRTALSSQALEQIRVPLGARGVESYLLTLPGFAMNANGAIHPRGAHNQMTFVIDGLPISDQLTGAFATALDAGIVDSLELYTGDVPAEFGAKVSGVAAISTHTGVGSGRASFGSVQMSAGQFDTLQSVVQAGGEIRRFAYFASFSAVGTHRFLDAVSLDNLHNGGNSERGFLRLDYQPSDHDWLRFSVMTGRSSFELANLRSQQFAGMNQRQQLRDLSVWAAWNHVLSNFASWETIFAYRPTVSVLTPSPGDTPVTAGQSRHLTTLTLANRLSLVHGRHNLRSGIDLQHFPVSEDFSMAITDPRFNVPGSVNFNDSLLKHDLSRGGRPFHFSHRAAGSLYSAFLQDMVKAGRFTFSLGARYDNYRFMVNGGQLQPRIGLAFHLMETGTVLRASYNRNYQTPPNENLLLSNSPEASELAPTAVRQALGATFVPIQPQRENVYEVGLQQALLSKATLNVSFYHKDSVDQQDNNNFFNTGIIFPVTLASIRVNGVEARLTLPSIHKVTATLSATHARAVSTPPFTGGLYIGQDAVSLLSAGPFIIDHDQKLSLQSNVNYAVSRRWWANTSVRYDSGLVANPSDPRQVAADPDYSDLLPLVKLVGTPARVGPRTITGVSAGYQHWREDRRTWSCQFQVNNVFNSAALYNFQSVFVGTRVVAPRAFSVKFQRDW
ncbi:MAG TPA: TonB-dependent receptor [Terriglobales bacterium]|nr:TonB-dependent receptor [Terriglobales bacterium]